MTLLQKFWAEMAADINRINIYAPDYIEPEALLYLTDKHYVQGFGWIPHRIDFVISLGEGFEGCPGAVVEVHLEQTLPQPQPDSIRAIQLPLNVGSSGALIECVTYDFNPTSVALPEGDYGLLFEYKLRNDVEYLNSERYLAEKDIYDTQISCRFTFVPQVGVEPKVLRSDPTLSPIQPMPPIYPLLMEAEFVFKLIDGVWR